MPPLPPTGSPITAEDELAAHFGGAYAAFYQCVANSQLQEWLPTDPSVVLDLSAADGCYAMEIAQRGHTVLHVAPPNAELPTAAPRLHTVFGEIHDLRWLRRESFDAVLAESSTMSACLAFEESLAQIKRALRPGGKLLLSVDSLTFGLSRLAEQGRWAELADVPSADVVLVPTDDGRITRCFWPEELADVLAHNGFAAEWIRPRTVLSPGTVRHSLEADPGRLMTLVETEVMLERTRAGESTGYHLVASATRLP